MTDQTEENSSDLIIHLETVIKNDSEKTNTSSKNEPEVIELSEDDDDVSTIAASEHEDVLSEDNYLLEGQTCRQRSMNNESPTSCVVTEIDARHRSIITENAVSCSQTLTRKEMFVSGENNIQSRSDREHSLQATCGVQDDLTILQSMLLQQTNQDTGTGHKRSAKEIPVHETAVYKNQVSHKHGTIGPLPEECRTSCNPDELHVHKKSKQYLNIQQPSSIYSNCVPDITNTSPSGDSGYSYHSSPSFGPYSLRPSMPQWYYNQRPNTYWQIRGSNLNQIDSYEPYLSTYGSMYSGFDQWVPRSCPRGGPYVPNLRFSSSPYQSNLMSDPTYSINIHMPETSRPSVSHSFVVNTSDNSNKENNKDDNRSDSRTRNTPDDNLLSRVSLVIENRLREFDENENETSCTNGNTCASEKRFSEKAHPSLSKSKRVLFSRTCTTWKSRETSRENSVSKSMQLKQLRNRGKTFGAISKDKRIDKLIRPWPCNACDRKFGSRKGLLLHMKSKSVKGQKGHTDSLEEIEQYLDHVRNDFSWYLTPGLDEEENKELPSDEIAFFRGNYKASCCWSDNTSAKPVDSIITIKSESEDTEHSDDCYAEYEEYICYICGESFVDQDARNSHIDKCYKEN